MKKIALTLFAPLVLAACHSTSPTESKTDDLENISTYREASSTGTILFAVGQACENGGVKGSVSVVREQLQKIISSKEGLDGRQATALVALAEKNFKDLNQKPAVKEAYQGMQKSIKAASKDDRIYLCNETIKYYLADLVKELAKLN